MLFFKLFMKLVYTFLVFIIFSKSLAQSGEKYLFPIRPGEVASLAGNLGELRSNHFHTGIDIRTNNQIGYAVYAAKSGYISRAAMSAGGYGNVLYVTHPDGNTTVYAHLEAFRGGVADYVRKEQYRRKTFDIDLYFRQNQFPVKQGDTIALSGNTGSSSGPHLHFDIRDKNNLALDPLSFGFKEVVDASPPYTEKIALKTLDITSRINDRFGRTEFYVQRSGNNFFLPYPILAYGNVGLEILAKDKMAAGSPYFGGVNYMEVYVQDTLIFKQEISKLNITEGRAINTLLSFRSLRNGNNKFYKLYLDDGNTLPFYTGSPSDGKISVAPGKELAIKVVSNDVFGNTSTLSFRLKGTEPAQQLLFDNTNRQFLRTDIIDHTLQLIVMEAFDSTSEATAFSNASAVTMKPAYGGKYSTTYLVDLKKELPDSIHVAKLTYATNFKARIPSSMAYTYYGENVEVFFPKSSLYSTLYFQVSGAQAEDSTESITLGDPLVPLHRFIGVFWKAKNVTEWKPSLAVYRKTGNDLAYIGGSFTNGRIHFNVREFGTYTLAYDTVPPSIKPIILNSASVSFKIKDNLSGIDRYEATINGKWLLLYLDGKSGTLRSERLDKTIPLKGQLSLTVTDRAGNKETFTTLIP